MPHRKLHPKLPLEQREAAPGPAPGSVAERDLIPKTSPILLRRIVGGICILGAISFLANEAGFNINSDKKDSGTRIFEVESVVDGKKSSVQCDKREISIRVPYEGYTPSNAADEYVEFPTEQLSHEAVGHVIEQRLKEQTGSTFMPSPGEKINIPQSCQPASR
jgi:hypothetical protein